MYVCRASLVQMVKNLSAMQETWVQCLGQEDSPGEGNGLQPTRFFCLVGILPGKSMGVGCYVLLQGIWPTQGMNPDLLHCRWILYHLKNSLPSKPPGKTKNTEVGSLSLLQGIFPTQELIWSLLLCRWILYQLNQQGNHPYPHHLSKQLAVFYLGLLSKAKSYCCIKI